jgi:hypothetical protein
MLTLSPELCEKLLAQHQVQLKTVEDFSRAVTLLQYVYAQGKAADLLRLRYKPPVTDSPRRP